MRTVFALLLLAFVSIVPLGCGGGTPEVQEGAEMQEPQDLQNPEEMKGMLPPPGGEGGAQP
jgi:hypothetical protein